MFINRNAKHIEVIVSELCSEQKTIGFYNQLLTRACQTVYNTRKDDNKKLHPGLLALTLAQITTVGKIMLENDGCHVIFPKFVNNFVFFEKIA